MKNIILSTDSYKHSHFRQLPEGTKRISSYIEARKGHDTEQVSLFFGLQAFLREYLEMPINRHMIDEAEELVVPHGLPFNRAGWDRIVSDHDGYLPLRIEALPEGLIVPRGTPMVQVTNTDMGMPWLTSFIETALLRAIWYPTSVATLSFLTKTIIYDALLKSSDDPDGQLPFKLHDFGARGVSSSESAALGGMAHLVNFKGTDTIEGMIAARRFYDTAGVPAFSIPASEHSTMTAWGRAGEYNAYFNMVEQFGNGLFSVVSDSYDLWNAVAEIFGSQLRAKVEGMEGVLVVRPDSGDPVTTPLQVLEILWEKFGGTVNSKGFKVLNPKVRVIQGDGMNAHSIGILLMAVMSAGFSVDNIAFGMGGGLLQGHMRDDMRFAMKASAIDFGDGWQDVQKNPATDPSKASKAGRQAVVRGAEDRIITIREDKMKKGEENLLRCVYDERGLCDETDFDEVRDRAHQEMLTFHKKVFSDVPQAA
ncbi:MAG: nicotinate phosphoribosyltransferase [Stutzerimonas stutzeri]|nr:MAG: nicotinate phosphoribosyltransferase [Stutzerimonas stutzeri]